MPSVRLPKPEPVEIRVYNIAGQKIWRRKTYHGYKNNGDQKTQSRNREIEQPVNFDKNFVNNVQRYNKRNQEEKTLEKVLADPFHDSPSFSNL